jgi:hypothetical protein
MLVLAVHQTPSLTRERYGEVVRRLTNGRAGSVGVDLLFEGLIVHAAGQGKSGFCVIDIFESEEAVARFNEAMASIPPKSASSNPRTSSPPIRSSRASRSRHGPPVQSRTHLPGSVDASGTP